MKRHILTVLILAALVSTGCKRPDRSAGEDSDPARKMPASGDWIITRFEAEPDNLNLVISTSSYTQYIMTGPMGSLLSESLLQYDPNTWRVTATLLAEAYPEISEDHLLYTFKIREGVKWHDGRPFTVDDVLFSIKALMVPFVDSASLRGYFADVAKAEIIEDRKIRFTMKKPYWLNAESLGTDLAIIPKHVYDPEGLLDKHTFADIVGPKAGNDETLKKFGEQFNKHPANRAPIGTGPYKFEKWDTGKEIVLVRNDDYWGKKGYLDRLVFRTITDSTAALTALKSGEVDFNPRLLPIQYAQQTSGANFEQQFAKATYTIPNYSYIGWNSARPYFSDKRVRQALTMLINREEIVRTLRFGLGKVAAASFNPSSPDFNPNIKPWPYDPKRAAQLLDEAGWTDHDGDGTRDKGGVPFRFEFLGSAGSTFVDQLLPILKEEFKKVGIDMTERRLEFTVLIEGLRDKRFDAATAAWTSGLNQDPNQLFHSNSIASRGSNFFNFSNAEADRLIEQARVEFDPEKRKQLYWRFQEIIHEEQPYTFLFYPQEAGAYHRRFQDVKWLPVRPGYSLAEWFVPKLSQRYTTTAVQ